MFKIIKFFVKIKLKTIKMPPYCPQLNIIENA